MTILIKNTNRGAAAYLAGLVGMGLASAATASPTLEYDKSWALQGNNKIYITDSVVDAAGNTYMVGDGSNRIDMDPTSGTDYHESGPQTVAYVTRLNADGSYGWSNVLQSTSGHNDVDSVTLDSQGNIYMFGTFQATLDFDLGAGVASRTAVGTDFYLAKYAADGSFVNVWTMAGGANAGKHPYAVVLDSQDNIYLTGYYNVSVDFDPSAGSDVHTPSGDTAFLTRINADGSYGWTHSFHSSTGSYGVDLEADSQGNLYMAGGFIGTVDLDPGAGVVQVTSTGGSYDSFVLQLASDGSYGWSRVLGGSGSQSAPSITLGNNNALFVTGGFNASTDFDPTAGSDVHTTNGGYDVFVSRWDTSGNYAWTRTFGGAYSEFSQEVVADGRGNAFIGGYFYGTVDFDWGAGTDERTTHTSYKDYWYLQLSESGDFIWVNTGGIYNKQDEVRGLAVGIDNSIRAFGDFSHTQDFDPGPEEDSLSVDYLAFSTNAFITKWDALPQESIYDQTWTIRGISKTYMSDSVVDAAGNVYMAGDSHQTVDLDPTAGVDSYNSGSATIAYLTRLNADGSYGWSHVLHSNMGHNDVDAVDVDSQGNVYMFGTFQGTLDFDHGPGVAALTAVGTDMYVAKYASDGSYLNAWAMAGGANAGKYPYAMVLDAQDNIYLTGYYNVSVDFDPTAGSDVHNPSGDTAFLTRINADGSYGWTHSFNSTSGSYGVDLDSDAQGNVYMAGGFIGTVDLDPGVGVAQVTSSGGTYDSFVLQLQSDGSYGWSHAIRGSGTQSVQRITLGNNNALFVTGGYTASTDFDPTAGSDVHATNGGYDAFVSRWDTSGNYSWTRTVGGAYTDISRDVAADAYGNVYIGGYFYGTVDFDWGAGTDERTAHTSYKDYWYLRLSDAGDFVWVNSGGIYNKHDEVRGLAMGPDASLYAFGDFSHTQDFDPGPGTDSHSVDPLAFTTNAFITRWLLQ